MMREEATSIASHDEVLHLLPWYANGTLKAAEHRAVAEHLRSCDECRRELADFQMLQVRWQQAPASPKAESAFDRLMAKIDAADLPDPTAATVVGTTRAVDGAIAPTGGFRRRFSEWLHGLPAVSNTRLTAVSVFGAVLLAIIGARAWVWFEPSGYRTLGLPAAEGSAEPRYVRVVFAPKASVGEVVRLIESLDARIVDGPTEPGAFTVRLGRSQTNEVSVQQLAERLRADPAVIFAEPASLPSLSD
ncbi:MAG: hypothetical protein FJ189_02610 [Gammaproteobacteria bacterium]|nr:hypothetical protein [Gammaproteobacteria bacterium]